jgi:hypothetical protein
MDPLSRRSFFKHAGVAAAVAGTVAVVPGVIGASDVASAARPAAPLNDAELAASEPVVAHLVDARTGEIAVYVGSREVTLRDRDMATRLLRAAR